MEPIAISLLVAAAVFAAGLLGLFADRLLPDPHLTSDTRDVVRLAVGLLSVLASLVLGLLIATAKTSWDATDHALRAYAADLILLDETLRDYGDGAKAPRAMLRDYTKTLLDDIWPSAPGAKPSLDEHGTGIILEHVREQIRALKPVDDGTRWLQEQALTTHISLLRQRWQIIEQQGPSVRPLVLVILVTWVAVIFASFGLNAPRNATVIAVFFVCALSIGGAIFLILEMDSPFSGALRISSAPLHTALDHMSSR